MTTFQVYKYMYSLLHLVPKVHQNRQNTSNVNDLFMVMNYEKINCKKYNEKTNYKKNKIMKKLITKNIMKKLK